MCQIDCSGIPSAVTASSSVGPSECLSTHSGNSVNYAKFGSAAVLLLTPELASLKPEICLPDTEFKGLHI